MIKAGDTVEIKKEFQDDGDDALWWHAVEDEDGGRVRIRGVELSGGGSKIFTPTQVVRTDMLVIDPFTQIILDELESFGWKRFSGIDTQPNRGSAIATKTYKTEVGDKVATAYLLSPGARLGSGFAEFGTLQGAYESEGGNVLSGRGSFIPSSRSKDVAEMAKMFALDADKDVNNSYARKLYISDSYQFRIASSNGWNTLSDDIEEVRRYEKALLDLKAPDVIIHDYFDNIVDERYEFILAVIDDMNERSKKYDFSITHDNVLEVIDESSNMADAELSDDEKRKLLSILGFRSDVFPVAGI